MKNIYIILIVSLIFIGYSCKKELTSEGVSKITTYPVLKLKGNTFMTIKKGATYTEPGFIATIGETDVVSKVQSSGNVDNTTPGVYILNYKITNDEGYFVEIRRWVGVIDSDAEAADISGTYVRTNGVNCTFEKKAMGLYTTNNVGGVNDPSYIYPVYVFNTVGKTLVVPQQPNALGGDVYCTGITFSGTQIKWTVMGAGYGTAVRTFNKQ